MSSDVPSDPTSEEEEGGSVGELNLSPSDVSPPYDPEPSRDKVRAAIALLLIGLFCVEVLVLMIGVTRCWLDIANAKELATLVVPPTIGLAGAATGFYYGTKPKA
jgi:hypothetical protein